MQRGSGYKRFLVRELMNKPLQSSKLDGRWDADCVTDRISVQNISQQKIGLNTWVVGSDDPSSNVWFTIPATLQHVTNNKNDKMWFSRVMQPMYKRWRVDDVKFNGFDGESTTSWYRFGPMKGHICVWDETSNLDERHPDLRVGGWARTEREFMMEFVTSKYLWIVDKHGGIEPSNWMHVYGATTLFLANKLSVRVFSRRLAHVKNIFDPHSFFYKMVCILLSIRLHSFCLCDFREIPGN